MDGPRWNNLRQLNLYPLSLHLKMLHPNLHSQGSSETVVSEKQDVKPECVPVPDIRWRRSMTLPDYKKTFLVRVDYDLRASLYVSAPTKRKILEVLKKIGGERLTATSYVDNILRHHLEMFRDEINCIHQEQNYHNIV
jgi:hypothetical protein